MRRLTQLEDICRALHDGKILYDGDSKMATKWPKDIEARGIVAFLINGDEFWVEEKPWQDSIWELAKADWVTLDGGSTMYKVLWVDLKTPEDCIRVGNYSYGYKEAIERLKPWEKNEAAL